MPNRQEKLSCRSHTASFCRGGTATDSLPLRPGDTARSTVVLLATCNRGDLPGAAAVSEEEACVLPLRASSFSRALGSGERSYGGAIRRGGGGILPALRAGRASFRVSFIDTGEPRVK